MPDTDAKQPETLEAMATRLGQCQFSPAQAALVMEIPRERLEDGPLLEAFVRGRLRAQAMVRHTIVQQALEGDPAMVKEFQRLAAESDFAIE